MKRIGVDLAAVRMADSDDSASGPDQALDVAADEGCVARLVSVWWTHFIARR